jgi:hypothetical protein
MKSLNRTEVSRGIYSTPPWKQLECLHNEDESLISEGWTCQSAKIAVTFLQLWSLASVRHLLRTWIQWFCSRTRYKWLSSILFAVSIIMLVARFFLIPVKHCQLNPGSDHRAPSEDRNGQIDNSSSMLYVISFAWHYFTGAKISFFHL